MAKILDLVKKDNPSNLDLVELSNVIKQTNVNYDERNAERKQKVWFNGKEENETKKFNFQVRNFVKEADKLKTAGISLG